MISYRLPEFKIRKYNDGQRRNTREIYITRTLIGKALEVQKDLYICFIDYTKAFDRVRHE